MKNRSPASVPAQITVVYIIAGAAWVTVTVAMITAITTSGGHAALLDVAVDLGFIAITAMLLNFFLRREISHRRALELVRDETREALVDSVSRYTSLASLSPVGIFHADHTGQHISFNERWSEITGLSAGEGMGDGWMQCLHPDDRAAVVAKWRDTVANGTAFESDYRVQRPDGEIVWVASRAIPLDDHKDRLTYLGVLTDITVSRQAEAAVKQAARDYQLLFELSPLPVWIADIHTLRFLAVNERAIKVYGYTREEFLSMTLTDIRPAAEIPRMMDVIKESGRNPLDTEPVVHRLKDGTLIYVRVTSDMFEYHGKPARIVAITDVTEQIRAEKALRYQAGLLEATSDAVISTDNDLRIQSWNAAAERIYGWKAEEVIGRPMVDVVSVLGLPERERYHRELADQGAWKGDFRHRRKDGTTFLVSGSVAEIHDQDGNAIGYVSINRDITEYRRADAELRQRNRELEALLSVSTALSGRFDLDLMLDSITAVTGDILAGVERASLWLYDGERGHLVLRSAAGFGNGYRDSLTTPPQGSLVELVFSTRQAVNIADTAQSSEFKVVGDPRLDCVKSVIGVPLIAEGQVIGCLFGDSVTHTHAFTNDDARLLMTLAGHAALAILDAQLHEQMQNELVERLRAEETLRASEELYRLAFKATPKVAIWDWRIVDDMITWSDGIETVYGYGPRAIGSGIGDVQEKIHPDDREEAARSIEEALRGPGQNWAAEYRFQRNDNSYALVSVRGFVVRDSTGRAVRMIGSMVDITEQKESEAALRRSEERFRRIAESAPDMIFRWTFRSGFEYVSPAASDISGYSPEEFYQAPDLLHRIVHSEDQTTLDEAFDAAQTGSSTLSQTLRWYNKRGELVHIELRYMPLRDDEGEMLGIEGIAHDVTQHVIAASRLRELGQRLASTQDRERKQVALELHDDVGQRLTVAKMRLKMAINALPRDSMELRNRLGTLTMLVDDSLESIRALSHELHPPLLAEMGWQAAIEGLCESLRARSKLSIVFRNTGRMVRLPSDTEIAIYRLAQEALTNALRHGEPGSILVTSRVSQRSITIQIEDDGAGFDIEQIRSASQPEIGLGLLSMQERADAIDGKLTITSRPGHGTKVVLRLPCGGKGSGT